MSSSISSASEPETPWVADLTAALPMGDAAQGGKGDDVGNKAKLSKSAKKKLKRKSNATAAAEEALAGKKFMMRGSGATDFQVVEASVQPTSMALDAEALGGKQFVMRGSGAQAFQVVQASVQPTSVSSSSATQPKLVERAATGDDAGKGADAAMVVAAAAVAASGCVPLPGPDQPKNLTCKSIFSCRECKEPVEKNSEFLLDTIEDWCGNLTGICSKCSDHYVEGETKAADKALKAFVKACKAQWQARKIRLHGIESVVRTVNFKNIDEKLQEYFPGMPFKARRELAVQRLKCMVTSMTVGFVETDPVAKELAGKVVGRWMETLTACANDPANRCVYHANKLTGCEAQYLTSLSRNMHISFVCRYEDCRLFGANHHWIKGAKWQFRCPICKRVYSGFKQTAGMIAAAKVVTCVDMEGKTIHFGASWPETVFDNTLQSLMELYAHNPTTAEEVRQWEERDGYTLQSLLAKYSRPLNAWRHWDWVSENEYMLSAMTYPRAGWQFLVDNGMDGAIFDNHAEPVFTEWPMLIGLLRRSLE